MAKCTITFEDTEEPGNVDIKVEFDPDLKNPLHGHKPTHAQSVGWSFAQAIIEQDQSTDDE